MLPLLHLVKWKGSSCGPVISHSLLVDFVQIHVRNVFLFCFGLSLARQLFGDNINCQVDGLKLGQSYLDMKCLINGTHSNVTHDGITIKMHHYYYQWIPVLLLLMALSVHLPCRTWFKFMGYYINELTTKIVDKEACDRVLQVVIASKGNGLFWKTVALEYLYIIHLGIHIWVLNLIFHQAWSTYHWFPISVIPILFPEEARCYYDYFTGGMQTVAKSMCLLPLNTVYRKVFWIVYVTLASLIIMHVACFGYRLYQTCTVGVERINMWWCMQVAKSQAQNWHTKQLLQKLCFDHIMTAEAPKYISGPVDYEECYKATKTPKYMSMHNLADPEEMAYDVPPELPPKCIRPVEKTYKTYEMKTFTDV